MFSELEIGDLLNCISAIKKRGGEIYTNYYGTEFPAEVTKLKIIRSEYSVVFSYPDREIERIFFYSANKDELICYLSLFSVDSVVDIVSRQVDTYEHILNRAGYEKYAVYYRMSMNLLSDEVKKIRNEINRIETENYREDIARKAELRDLDIIYNKLYEIFDPFESHFYSRKELINLIEKGYVFLHKDNNKLVALSIFKIEGRKKYWAFDYNEGDIDVSCSLKKKAGLEDEKNNIQYHYAWVNKNNKRQIRLLKLKGFTFDGLYDIIYVKKR